MSARDTAGGSFPTQHDFTWGLGGLLYDTFQSAVYTPGVSQRVNGTDTFLHTDWLGSTRYLSDNTGNTFPAALRYDAFGQRTDMNSPWDPTPFQFAGDWGYQSEFATGPEGGTGLQYLEQRYYDPATGRFISPDPVGFWGSSNVYSYAENDPVNGVDPDGLQFRGAPDPFDYEGSSDRFGADPRNRPFRQESSRIAGGLRTGIEFVGSFNEVTNVGLAANDVQAHRYGSAALRLIGPIAKAAPELGASGLWGRFTSFLGRLFGGRPRAINLAGEGEIAAVLNVNGRWLLDPRWRSSRTGATLTELLSQGHRFVIADNLRLPFADNSLDVVYTNNVRINGSSHLGAFPQASEIWRVLKPSGVWINNGVRQLRSR